MWDRWGYQVEIVGTVPDDASAWTIEQVIQEIKTTTYFNVYFGETATTTFVSSDAETLKGSNVSQPAGSHRIFAIDAPGLPKGAGDNLTVSGHIVMNVTTSLRNYSRHQSISRDWAIELTVANRQITSARFYDHYVVLR